MAGDWNILAGRLDGDGFIDIVETELPMTISNIGRKLSAPSVMDGAITNEIKKYKNQGRPVFEPWNTVLIAEQDGEIRGLTVYRKPTFTGPSWALDQIGLPGYAIGMPFEGDASYTAADPLNIFRDIWSHIQGWPGGNLGITIDPLTSPVRVGTPTDENDSQSGPRTLNWWSTPDLGKVIDDYAKETPFDWLEQVSWVDDQPHCHLALGYPTIGGRKDHLRLVLGENLATVPGISETDYTNGIWVLGAGEGRDRVRGYASVADGRLRRVVVVDDKSRGTVPEANALANEQLGMYRGQFVIDSIDIYDHPNAPISAIEPGDEIPLYAETDWVEVDQYVRVVGIDQSPQKSDMATLTVVRGVQP